MRHGRTFPGQVIIKRTNRIYFLLPTFGETIIGTDTVKKSTTRILLDGAIGTDTVTRVIAHLLTLLEGMIGTDRIAILLNGSDVIWTHVTKSAAAVWTKITRN